MTKINIVFVVHNNVFECVFGVAAHIVTLTTVKWKLYAKGNGQHRVVIIDL